MMSQKTSLDGVLILNMIINRLLVPKGIDWTSPILSEYMDLFKDSLSTFALVWDNKTSQFVSHGALFQSKINPVIGLLAHIRTLDEFQNCGLGTLVTRELTRAAFEKGAKVIALATDDKLNRIDQGEKAACSLYEKIGYTLLAKKELADTVDYLMVINQPIYELHQDGKKMGQGLYLDNIYKEFRRLQKNLITQIQAGFSSGVTDGCIQPISDGDLANLFLLLNLCPSEDFKIKLSAWGIHQGPEFEREYMINIRPAIADQDRLEDASLILLDNKGIAVAICAARQAIPFTRNTMLIDFYSLPDFVEENRHVIEDLITETITRIQHSQKTRKPCRLSFSGIDERKISLFQCLGFKKTENRFCYFNSEGEIAFETQEYVRILL